MDTNSKTPEEKPSALATMFSWFFIHNTKNPNIVEIPAKEVVINATLFIVSPLLYHIKKEEKILKEVLDNLKRIEAEREKEYLLKQNQVATYLKCRKTFFGKVRYFFKGKLKD